MRTAIAALVLAAGCATPATLEPAPHPADAWIAEALAGYPTLAAEVDATPNVWAPDGSPGAYTYSRLDPGGQRIAWNTAALTWGPSDRLDVAAHEAGHVLADNRWLVIVWPGGIESFADCFATAIRGHAVTAHGGCQGNPTDALAAVS